MSFFPMMTAIADDAGATRDALRQIRIDDGYAVATDAYRAVRVDLTNVLEVNSVPSGSIVPKDGEWPDTRFDWEQLLRDHLDEKPEYSFPNTSNIFRLPRVESALEWEGAGKWNHGRRQREWQTDLKQWAYYNGDRRKPVGSIKMFLDLEGGLHYSRGMTASSDKNLQTSFVAFENTKREIGVKATGLLERFDKKNAEDGHHLIGIYNAAWLSAMWHNADRIGVRATGSGAYSEVDKCEIWFGYPGHADGVLMPIRM